MIHSSCQQEIFIGIWGFKYMHLFLRYSYVIGPLALDSCMFIIRYNWEENCLWMTKVKNFVMRIIPRENIKKERLYSKKPSRFKLFFHTRNSYFQDICMLPPKSILGQVSLLHFHTIVPRTYYSRNHNYFAKTECQCSLH